MANAIYSIQQVSVPMEPVIGELAMHGQEQQDAAGKGNSQPQDIDKRIEFVLG
jgi:hypothetical protein